MGANVYIEEKFEHNSYKCVCVFTKGGYRCGYVAVNTNHPYYGLSYDNEGPDEILCHWGLTYAGNGNHFNGGEDGLWWFGFDCGHYNDLTDYETAKNYGLINDKEYSVGMVFENILKEDEDIILKDKEFVKDNCKMIVEQLRKVGAQ